ncbi:MAG: TonB-dependent receptor plug domain-containing protein, partial [Massilibacteroides sp.]|nr:TonB-dependent receptor plug domain-containing protein [Massilibacteroides sp.]
MKNDYGKMDSKSMRILTASFAMMVLSTFAMPLMATNAIAINTTHSVEINQADNLTIKGKIVDETGLGVIGANILEVGTTNGAMSDLDGNFTLTVPANAKLKISYIGYTDQTINVNGQTQFNITLAEDSQALDEVVVIGYGTTTKRKLVGAVSSISSEKLEKTPFNNVTDALQGQVSGLIVQSEGGQPGSVPSVSIRGGGTPLYVIDGVIASEYEFSVLNNNDISSISFLKDASATAVYGSKAGDGIILVKT